MCNSCYHISQYNNWRDFQNLSRWQSSGTIAKNPSPHTNDSSFYFPSDFSEINLIIMVKKATIYKLFSTEKKQTKECNLTSHLRDQWKRLRKIIKRTIVKIIKNEIWVSSNNKPTVRLLVKLIKIYFRKSKQIARFWNLSLKTFNNYNIVYNE